MESQPLGHHEVSSLDSILAFRIVSIAKCFHIIIPPTLSVSFYAVGGQDIYFPHLLGGIC